MIYKTIFLATLTAADMNAQTSILTEAENKELEQAINDSDNGRSSRAINIILGILNKHPDDIALEYELAYAYFQSARYDDVVEVCEHVEANGEAPSIIYQIEGNAQDESGDSESALKTYERGLMYHPEAGELYMEIGTVMLRQLNMDAAINSFENGIEAAPTYLTNYYKAAMTELEQGDACGVMRAEEYRLMDPTSERSMEMSMEIYEYWQKYHDSESWNNRLKSTANATKEHEELSESTTNAIKVTLEQQVPKLKRENLLTLREITALKNRVRQEYLWGTDKRMMPKIFSFEQKVQRAGLWEPYCMWLIMAGDTKQFQEWLDVHQEDFKEFATWLESNPYK